MKSANLLVLASLSLASVSLVAQQPASSEPQQSSPPPPAAEQQQPPTQSAPQAAQPNAGQAAATQAQMSPVNGELVSALDTKTAKTGDSVILKTESATTTADGTQIPKGTKLVGHVLGVKPSGTGNENSQVALQFDHAELQSGRSLPIHSEIQSLAPSDAAVHSGMASTPGAATAGEAPNRGSMNGGAPASPSAQQSSAAPQIDNGANNASMPAPGTVVARTGNIAIRTTSIPGVLLAVNEPGQQDPRMAQSSGILLGAKRDVHLDQGTVVVIGVAAAGAIPAGN
ncbi:MAG TPA: hypothetical protein VL967_09780 [Terracidiphilus sp.]|nr:hypothetical protein [Terracidiphilus sp.]